MAAKPDRRDIVISALWLDPENPRFRDPVASEEAALKEMLKIHGPEVLVLAADIVAKGPNPSDLPIVYHGDKGLWIVAEGNRRLTALKLLTDQKLAKKICKADYLLKIQKLSKAWKEPVSELLCVVEDSEDRRAHWMGVKHRGRQRGLGTVGWGTPEETRFDQRRGKKTQNDYALKVLDLVAQHAGKDSKLVELIRSTPLTSLQRLLNTKKVRDALGIDKKNGEPVITVDDQAAVLNAITHLVTDLAKQVIKVENIMNKEQREDLPLAWAEKRKPGNTATIIAPKPFDPIGPSAPASKSQANSVAKGGSKGTATPPHVRQMLIPASCTCRIKNSPKGRKLFVEMRSLKVEDQELCAAIALRVFLETTVDSFIDAKKIPCNQREFLAKKMELVAGYLESNGILHKDRLKGWRRAYTTDHLFSVNGLHSYIHDKEALPSKKEVMMTWDRMQPYVEVIWNNC